MILSFVPSLSLLILSYFMFLTYLKHVDKEANLDVRKAGTCEERCHHIHHETMLIPLHLIPETVPVNHVIAVERLVKQELFVGPSHGHFPQSTVHSHCLL